MITVQSAAAPARKHIPTGQLMIGGKWRDAETGETVDNLDPTTEGVGTVTIGGMVGSGSLTPAAVAEAFLELSSAAPGRDTAEVVLRP